MKALVLAGGSGSRLRPITHASAKQLVPVGNKPVLFYCLEAIAEAGLHEVGIVVGDRAAEIEQAVGDGSSFGLTVTYLPQAAPLGIAHAVLIARDYLAEDDFVLYLGDNFIVGGIAGLVESFRAERPSAQIVLTRVSNPEAFGIAELDSVGRVIRLEEKPAKPKSDIAVAGVYFFSPVVHDMVAKVKPSWRGELEITDAIQGLIDSGFQVASTIISGYWKDTGNVDDMLEVNRLVLEGIEPVHDGLIEDSELIGRVVVDKSAQVSGSRILGPSIIGPGSIIRNSYIGPYTSIDSECQVINSEIEHSIVLCRVSIDGVSRIESSLIGREVRITHAPQAPRAHRFLLCDHSEVQISL